METDEIKEIISGANSVALVLKEKPEETEILCREALRIFFQGKGAVVYLFPETPPEFKNKWSPILENNFTNPTLSSEIFIRLPKNSFNVKEIGYEEDADSLTIKVTAEGEEEEKNNISIDVKPMVFDVLILLNAEETNFENYKEKISLLADEETLSEKIFEIAGDEIPANLLFASLLLETSHFRKRVTEGSLSLGQRLLSLNADKKIIDEILNKDFSLSFAQILGRALARTRLNEALESNWVFISKNDFERTGIENPDSVLVRRIAGEIKEIVPRQPVFVVLWEDKENNVRALLEPERKNLAGPYKNFSEAELQIQKNLKEIM